MYETAMRKRILQLPLVCDTQSKETTVSFDPDLCHAHVIALSGNDEQCKVVIDGCTYVVALSAKEVIDAILEQGKYERQIPT